MKRKTLPIITIDGPSGVGKGTLASLLSQKYQWHLLDSGSIYRVLAYSVQHNILLNEINIEDENAIAQIAEHLKIQFIPSSEGLKITLDHKEITSQIRSEEIGMLASKIAIFPKVRAALLKTQRLFAKAPGLVADGRDMGTVVFPKAQVKFFLEASAQERAKRRFKQLQKQNICASIERICADIIARDERDLNRAVAPLKPAKEAYLIDTSNLTIEQIFELACHHIEDAFSNKL